MYNLNDLESAANKYVSTNSLILVLSASSLIDTIWCFKRVVTSGDASLFIFL